jgi:signal transduction histidine kinase
MSSPPAFHRLPAGWARLPRHTLRLRLTLVYGGLFLVSAALLLAIVYVLVAHYTSGTGVLISSKTGPPGTLLEQGVAGNVARVPSPADLSLTPAQVVIQRNTIELQARVQHSVLMHTLLVDSGIALGLMAIGSIVLGWLVAGRALRPLRSMTSAAQEISASSLHRRLAVVGPDDELKQLGDTFDGLLGRLETAFDAQRQFVANASHELRTPLTLERTLLEVALADPNADVSSLRRACEQALAAGEQQERLIEALLTLSRSQRGLDRRETIDLAEVAADALQSAAGLDGLDVDAVLAPARANGDKRLAERLVANLVDNAARHNVPGGTLELRTGEVDGRAAILVANSGPEIDPAELGRLFEPFQRLEGDRAGGADGLGLGLSIVSAIAVAHGADLDAQPRDGGGLRIELIFPPG